MIAVIDYGVGNIQNVMNGLNYLGYDDTKVCLTKDIDIIKSSEAIILPGVGAFEDASKALKNLGLDVIIKEEASKGKFILGICLGMQLLFDKSYEFGEYKGLGLIDGEIVNFENLPKIPQMGWNNLEFNKEFQSSSILGSIDEGDSVYFVHSLYAKTKESNIIAYSNYYDVLVPGLVKKGNVYGMQFHPEKSSKTGLQLLKNFIQEVNK